MNLPTYTNPFSSPARTPKPQGIHFYKQDGSLVRFSEPMHFRSMIPPPPSPGVYVVLVRDAIWGPRPFKPIYFGKAASFSARVTTSHENYSDWCRAALGAGNLYVSLCWMSSSTDSQRSLLETSLINRYQPECNKMSRTASALYQALLRTRPAHRVSLASLLGEPLRRNALADKIAATKRLRLAFGDF